MVMLSTDQTQTTPTAYPTGSPENNTLHFISGLFWRKAFVGFRPTEAVVLELAKDRLTLYDNGDRQVFSVPLSAVQAHLTRIGTLKLTVSGVSYALFMKSGLRFRLSPALKARLEQYEQQSYGSSAMLSAAGSVGVVAGIARSGVTGSALPGMLGGATGVFIHGAAAHADDKLMNQWQAVFQQAGIPITGKSQQLLMGFVYAGVILLFLMAIVSIGYLIQHK